MTHRFVSQCLTCLDGAVFRSRDEAVSWCNAHEHGPWDAVPLPEVVEVGR